MKSLTILVVPISAVGHVNACTGTTLPLVKRGHRVVFLVEPAYQGTLKPLGFEEHIYCAIGEPSDPVNQLKAGEAFAYGFLENGITGPEPLETRFERLVEFFLYSEPARASFLGNQRAIKQALELYNPDLVIVDGLYLTPSLVESGIPWIKHISCTPLFYLSDEPKLPPGGSGLPANSDPSTWSVYQNIRRELFYSKRFNDYLEEHGFPRFLDDILMPETQLLTIYATPDELNYQEIRARESWFNIEVFDKNERVEEAFELSNLIPDGFLNDDLDGKFSGKWIYLSMGSMGAVDLDLMGKLIRVLGETDHKFVVSKGLRSEEYQLPRNMWGDRFLPQTKLIRKMDAIITHGGNNTVTETFAAGKPMLVMPLFADQYDNAQRLQETGLGERVDPYAFEGPELIKALDKLLYDTELNEKLQEASTRILKDDQKERVADVIETAMSNYLQ